MAWDLLLRRQLPGSCARGESPATPGLGLLPAAVAASVLVLPRVLRIAEIGYYRRLHSTDTHDRDLHATQEVPAITNYEMVYGPGGER